MKIEIGLALKKLDYPNLIEILKELKKEKNTFIHLDFIDGKLIKYKNKITKKEIKILRENWEGEIEAHIMELKPKEIKFYKKLGIDTIIFHHESSLNKKRLLLEAKKQGMKVGIALKPSSPHDKKNIIYPNIIDIVLIMGTQSGPGGVKYDKNTPKRIKEIKNIYKGKLECNSGVITHPKKSIREGTTYHLAKAGATRFAIGNGLLNMKIPISKAVKLNIKAAKLGLRQP